MEDNNSKIIDFLVNPQRIAIVGASSKPTRVSNEISLFLKDKGHSLFPIHPKEKTVLGDKVISSLEDLNNEVDGVIIYLNKSNVLEQIQVAVKKGIPLIWLPLSVTSEEGKALAYNAGITFIQDKCPKIEWEKLIDV